MPNPGLPMPAFLMSAVVYGGVSATIPVVASRGWRWLVKGNRLPTTSKAWRVGDASHSIAKMQHWRRVSHDGAPVNAIKRRSAPMAGQ